MAIRHYHLDYGSIKVENFPENEIQLAVTVVRMANNQTVAIDSVGAKYSTSRAYIPPELVKHAKGGVLIAHALTPTATDAVVTVDLKDDDTGDIIATVTFSGAGGTQTATLDADTVKALSGHQVHLRIYVSTASATAGATQTFDLAQFYIILGIS